jgi:hypothetical protein
VTDRFVGRALLVHSYFFFFPIYALLLGLSWLARLSLAAFSVAAFSFAFFCVAFWEFFAGTF